MPLTSAICRAGRNALGWTIEDLAALSGVGVSSIGSFEVGQRAPMRANLDALTRALTEGGVILCDTDERGRGLYLDKTAETVRDLTLIASFPGTDEYRNRRARQRVQSFYAAAVESYSGFYGAGGNALANVMAHVDSDMQKLLERVRWEINRRVTFHCADTGTGFLESMIDYLRSRAWVDPRTHVATAAEGANEIENVRMPQT